MYFKRLLLWLLFEGARIRFQVVSPYAMKAGDKAVFHFKAVARKNGKVVDDTEKMHNGPFELRIGKSFLLTEWEEFVRGMQPGETSMLVAKAETCEKYPQLSRVLREESKRKHAEAHGKVYHSNASHGCCAHFAQDEEATELLGLVEDGLDFEFKLLSVISANSYEKELWEMTVDEKVQSVEPLKGEGNSLFQAGEYTRAVERYSRAIAIVESLTKLGLPEASKPAPEVVESLRQLQVACLSNLCACELKLKEYAKVIEHATMGLEVNPVHAKLLFRRAKAYYSLGRDLEEAADDAQKALAQAPGDHSIVQLIGQITRASSKQAKQDTALYAKMLS
eukprot:m.78785 g.78785  ORF g.78785 m.78785 type:complete len:336 (-) comp12544_c0_seq1:173-1180(-)